MYPHERETKAFYAFVKNEYKNLQIKYVQYHLEDMPEMSWLDFCLHIFYMDGLKYSSILHDVSIR